MPAQKFRSSPEEVARRGDQIYEGNIRAQVEAQHPGKVVAIDINSAEYTIDDNGIDAARCLRPRHPEAEVWLVQGGQRTIPHIGARPSAGRA